MFNFNLFRRRRRTRPQTAQAKPPPEPTLQPEADLSVSVAAPLVAVTGRSIELFVTVANDGPAAGANVYTTIALDGLRFLSFESSRPIFINNKWQIGSIQPGARARCRIRVRVTADAGRTAALQANVISTVQDPRPRNNRVLTVIRVVPQP